VEELNEPKGTSVVILTFTSSVLLYGMFTLRKSNIERKISLRSEIIVVIKYLTKLWN